MSESTVINNRLPLSPYTMDGLRAEAIMNAEIAALHLNDGVADLARVRAAQFVVLDEARGARLKAELEARR